MPAPSTVFHQRRLFHGGVECLAIGLVAVPGDRDRISAGCSHQAVEMLFPGSASMGYRPVGEGLTGGGGWNIPRPYLLRLTEDIFPCEQSITLTSRRVPRLLPPPSEGAGSMGR